MSFHSVVVEKEYPSNSSINESTGSANDNMNFSSNENINPNANAQLNKQQGEKRKLSNKEIDQVKVPGQVAKVRRFGKLLFKNRPKRPMSALGYIDFLPKEIKYRLLRILSADGLIKFARCSAATNRLVLEYLQQKSTVRLVALSCFTQKKGDIRAQKCVELGKIFRICLALQPFAAALQTIEGYFLMMRDELDNKELFENSVSEPKRLLATGYVIVTFMHGKDARVYNWAVRAVEEDVKKRESPITTILSLNISPANVITQVALRLLYRSYFIDPCTDWEERAKWIVAIVAPLSLHHRATFLLILFGPTDRNAMWHSLANVRVTSVASATDMWGELGQALNALYVHGAWTKPHLIAVLKEIVKIPSPWLPINTALLLLFSGQAVTTEYVIKHTTFSLTLSETTTAYQLQLKLEQVARMFVDLVAAHQHFLENLHGVHLIDILQSIMDNLDGPEMRLQLLDIIWRLAINDLSALVLRIELVTYNDLRIQVQIMHCLRTIFHAFLTGRNPII